jgi:hypothetical protein
MVCHFRQGKTSDHGCAARARLAPACARRASSPLLAAPKPAKLVPFYSGANRLSIEIQIRIQRVRCDVVFDQAFC